MVQLVWFKRDLRVSDHPALAQAAALGPVLPLFVFEPDYWAQPDVSGRQFAFLSECVVSLAEDLARIGLTLCIRVGPMVQVLSDLRAETGFVAMHSHEETGNAWTFARDRDVAAWCQSEGVIWQERAQSGVVRRLNGRDGWAARRNGYLRQLNADVPEQVDGPVLSSDPIPRLLPVGLCPQRQRGGRADALERLDSFLRVRGQTYRSAMSNPIAGETACSRLSPYLALGVLSGREAAQAGAARQREIKGTRVGWSGSLKSFQARLAWRDHFMQKLEDEPALEHRCLHPAYQGLRGDDAVRRLAWEQGETGLPFVDAGMRYLNATGWLNFRMPSMLMAVASYHLWLDWRHTGLHLARQFTDYEPGIHWPQVQMQSGTTGMNTIRIYNPVKQGADQDPTGVFTRRWVPELAPVPDKYLQEPWKWEEAGALAYPPPIVNVTEAARAAREAVWAVRRGGAFGDKAAQIVEKHASRKDSEGHFVNDRAPRRPKPSQDPRQIGFDF